MKIWFKLHMSWPSVSLGHQLANKADFDIVVSNLWPRSFTLSADAYGLVLIGNAQEQPALTHLINVLHTAGIEATPTARVRAKANDRAETRLLRVAGRRECPREQRKWLGHEERQNTSRVAAWVYLFVQRTAMSRTCYCCRWSH